MKINEKRKLLQQYWDAHAQFGSFDVTPEEFIRVHLDDNETLGAKDNVVTCLGCGATIKDNFCYCAV